MLGNRLWVQLLALGLLLSVRSVAWAADQEAEYQRVIRDRASRIVDTLAIEDSEQRERVITLIAAQYANLRHTHEERDRLLKDPPNGSTAAKDASHRSIVELHRRFVAQLQAELDPQQVEQVKDGMTYGVVNVTYGAYLELLPDLTAEQKRHIRGNLLEAREYAMDAGSSDEKHAWFGKYKGRINNYLSAQGYDLKQAELDLARRSKQQ